MRGHGGGERAGTRQSSHRNNAGTCPGGKERVLTCVWVHAEPCASAELVCVQRREADRQRQRRCQAGAEGGRHSPSAEQHAGRTLCDGAWSGNTEQTFGQRLHGRHADCPPRQSATLSCARHSDPVRPSFLLPSSWPGKEHACTHGPHLNSSIHASRRHARCHTSLPDEWFAKLKRFLCLRNLSGHHPSPASSPSVVRPHPATFASSNRSWASSAARHPRATLRILPLRKTAATSRPTGQLAHNAGTAGINSSSVSTSMASWIA